MTIDMKSIHDSDRTLVIRSPMVGCGSILRMRKRTAKR